MGSSDEVRGKMSGVRRYITLPCVRVSSRFSAIEFRLLDLGQLFATQVHTWIGKQCVIELNIQKVSIDDQLAPMMLLHGQSYCSSQRHRAKEQLAYLRPAQL